VGHVTLIKLLNLKFELKPKPLINKKNKEGWLLL
jgi:hypothetical protein